MRLEGFLRRRDGRRIVREARRSVKAGEPAQFDFAGVSGMSRGCAAQLARLPRNQDVTVVNMRAPVETLFLSYLARRKG